MSTNSGSHESWEEEDCSELRLRQLAVVFAITVLVPGGLVTAAITTAKPSPVEFTALAVGDGMVNDQETAEGDAPTSPITNSPGLPTGTPPASTENTVRPTAPAQMPPAEEEPLTVAGDADEGALEDQAAGDTAPDDSVADPPDNDGPTDEPPGPEIPPGDQIAPPGEQPDDQTSPPDDPPVTNSGTPTGPGANAGQGEPIAVKNVIRAPLDTAGPTEVASGDGALPDGMTELWLVVEIPIGDAPTYYIGPAPLILDESGGWAQEIHIGGRDDGPTSIYTLHLVAVDEATAQRFAGYRETEAATGETNPLSRADLGSGARFVADSPLSRG